MIEPLAQHSGMKMEREACLAANLGLHAYYRGELFLRNLRSSPLLPCSPALLRPSLNLKFDAFDRFLPPGFHSPLDHRL
jgi:hypothetical protein